MTTRLMKRRETRSARGARTERAKNIFRRLRRLFPDAGMILRYGSPFELLVAVMLSAQCTDKKVNEVTPKLFERCRSFDDYLAIDRAQLERLVFSTGFYRTKAKRIQEAAFVVKHRFHGTLPRTMQEMLEIPGVARKTANVVLGNAYGIAEGIAVDTHVKRLARLFGLSDETDPVKIERDLMEVIPRREWFHATYLLIEFGRRYCPARQHDHAAHPLGDLL